MRRLWIHHVLPVLLVALPAAAAVLIFVAIPPAARAEYLRLAVVAEFTRRRDAQLADAAARKVPRGCRDGEFPDAELGMELVTSSRAAQDTARHVAGLPSTPTTRLRPGASINARRPVARPGLPRGGRAG